MMSDDSICSSIGLPFLMALWLHMPDINIQI
jgi:hypothetical protein